MNSLLLPAKCSSVCASACAVISILLSGLVCGAGQMAAHVNRHDVDQREYKHPDEVYEVPVESADFHVFVLQFVYSSCHDTKVKDARCDVEHVQSGDGEESRPESRRRRHAVSRRECLHPALR